MYTEEDKCEECGCKLKHFDSGYVKIGYSHIEWDAYKCPECGEIYSNEPDPDRYRDED